MEKKVEKLENLTFEKFSNLIDKENEQNLISLKEYLDDVYYNTGDTVLSDEKYDYIKEALLKKVPTYKPQVGAKLRKGENRVKLPVWLGSLNKITPENTNELAKWIIDNRSGNGYMISAKLDGVSGLLMVQNGKYNLYTRGDGIIGADITSILPYINYVPKKLPNIMVRGELVISIKTFEDKYKVLYKNARNMVSGLVNSKTAREGLKDLDFIVYEIIYSSKAPKPSEQYDKLEKLGFTTASHEIFSTLTVENLSEAFLKTKDESSYMLDGIVVQSNLPYDRNTSGNPEYAFAFKMRLLDNIAETEVIEVEWNISMRGKLIPRVKIEAVELNGVTIKHATGFNGKYIYDNNIGPGAIIQITRSGDVIPFIVRVITPAAEPQMPEEEYIWGSIKNPVEEGEAVDIYAINPGRIMCIKIVHHFFTTLGAKHVALKTLSKIYDYIGDNFNLIKLLKMKKSDFMKIEGIEEKSAERIYTNIHNAITNVPLYMLMGASSLFGQGIGVKKMKALLQDFPDILTEYKKMDREDLYERINSIEGFSDITTNKIVANLGFFILFLQKTKGIITVQEKVKSIKQNMIGMKFVFTGFRDKKMEEQIEAQGGSIVGSVSSKTSGVITNDENSTTGKIGKAKSLGIKIYTPEEFSKKYL
jgi:DNA ligase (NAD+)